MAIMTFLGKVGNFKPGLSPNVLGVTDARDFFRFLLGLTDLQDRISP